MGVCSKEFSGRFGIITMLECPSCMPVTDFRRVNLQLGVHEIRWACMHENPSKACTPLGKSHTPAVCKAYICRSLVKGSVQPVHCCGTTVHSISPISQVSFLGSWLAPTRWPAFTTERTQHLHHFVHTSLSVHPQCCRRIPHHDTYQHSVWQRMAVAVVVLFPLLLPRCCCYNCCHYCC